MTEGGNTHWELWNYSLEIFIHHNSHKRNFCIHICFYQNTNKEKKKQRKNGKLFKIGYKMVSALPFFYLTNCFISTIYTNKYWLNSNNHKSLAITLHNATPSTDTATYLTTIHCNISYMFRLWLSRLSEIIEKSKETNQSFRLATKIF
jgi:hypothetical protein